MIAFTSSVQNIVSELWSMSCLYRSRMLHAASCQVNLGIRLVTYAVGIIAQAAADLEKTEVGDIEGIIQVLDMHSAKLAGAAIAEKFKPTNK